MSFLGITADWKDVKNEWKAIIISTGSLTFFWYLAFFLFNRDLLLEIPFYITMIITIPLSGILLLIGYTELIFMSLLFEKVEEGKKKKTRPIHNYIYDSLIYCIVVFSVSMYVNKVYYNYSLTEFTEYIFLLNIGGIVLFLTVGFLRLMILMGRKKYKEEKVAKNL